MALPSFSEFLSPVLEALYKYNEASLSDLKEMMINRFSLTDEDISQTIQSGNQTTLYSRVSWSRTYLEKAGLAEKVGRGVTRITEEGRRVVESGDKVNPKYLLRYENYATFTQSKQQNSDKQVIEETIEKTPEESLVDSLNKMQSSLESDILEEIKKQSPEFFEHLVTDLLAKIYGGEFEKNKEVTGKTGDEGIDGIIKQDRLGFNNIYIQAKRWEGNVPRSEIQKFSGALDGQHATNGAFFTSSDYCKSAREYVLGLQNKHIALINGTELARLMIEYGVGVSVRKTIEIKKLDSDYFDTDNA